MGVGNEALRVRLVDLDWARLKLCKELMDGAYEETTWSNVHIGRLSAWKRPTACKGMKTNGPVGHHQRRGLGSEGCA